MSTAAEWLDLQSAANEIGVHYQTAYGWVRSGRLPAHTIGGRYRIARTELDSFIEQRSTPRAPAPPTPKRLATAAETMYTALTAGDEKSAIDLAREIVGDGAPIADLVQQVLVPPLLRIGQAWHDGELSIWVEHRASAITERLLGDVARSPRGPRRGTAMVAAVSGDTHSLATTMAAVALRDHRWTVHHLGADMPPDEIVDFCREHDITVAVITVTNPERADVAADVARRLDAAGTPTIVGGPGRTLDDLIDLAETSAPRPAEGRASRNAS